MSRKWDFSGWATKNNIKCSDGRTIMPGAFNECDGRIVPLVWNHQHNEGSNVLGHALLENRDGGVYAYCSFNDTESGQNAKMLVQHGDIKALSIYANRLKHQGSNVIHGMIREVSLVLAGANPGALIDSFCVEHSDDADLSSDAIIYTDEEIVPDDEEAVEEKQVETEEVEEPAEETAESEKENTEMPKTEELEHAEEKTVKDVFDEMTEEQKTVVYALVGQAIEDAKAENDKGESEEMKHNVFESDNNETMVLTHSDMAEIIANGKRTGSLKEAFNDFAEENNLDMESLSHSITDDDGNTVSYGLANVKYLFPDARKVMDTPDFIKREDTWVTNVLSSVHHTPFSRIKSLHADITMDDARAKGYLKGNLKTEEVFKLLKRVTDPTTIYKKQKMDRDDIIDITDFNVVAWIRQEMRMMLNEEIARAILIGDQRSSASNDKIDELKIRPIWTDAALYTVPVTVEKASTDTEESFAKKTIKAIIKSRKNYKGSGNPVFYTTEDFLTDCLLIEDVNGRVIYDTEEKLRTALRVSKIVTVPVMENLTRTVTTTSGTETRTMVGIVVNLKDYNVGADKGGEINMFDDFDIDYNQEKYLIETRCSGALIKPYSALVIESVPSGE